MNISFKDLSSICIKRGMIKDGLHWCSYRDKKDAQGWGDWQECCEENCPFKELKPITNITFDDLLKENNYAQN